MKFFKSAWGFDQTNIDFYVVLKETAKTVTLAEVTKNYKVIDTQNTEVKPDMENEKKLLKHITKIKKLLKQLEEQLKLV